MSRDVASTAAHAGTWLARRSCVAPGAGSASACLSDFAQTARVFRVKALGQRQIVGKELAGQDGH